MQDDVPDELENVPELQFSQNPEPAARAKYNLGTITKISTHTTRPICGRGVTWHVVQAKARGRT